MEPYWIYFLKAHTVLALGFVTYKLMLSSQTWFQTNRFLLLSISILLVFTPLLNPFGSFSQDTLFVVDLPEFVLSSLPSEQSTSINWFWFGGMIYLAVSAVLMLRMSWQVFQLLVIQKGERVGKYYFIPGNQLETSSFFNRIFLKTDLDPAAREVAITHEKIHADEWHTLDILWFEILGAIFWINPAMWLLKKELRDTHEYIADQKTKKQFGHEKYVNSLLNHAFSSRSIHFLPMFSNSQTLKNRIIMMTRKSSKKQWIRYSLALPLFAAMALLVACADEKPEPVEEPLTIADQTPEYPGGQEELFAYLGNHIKYPETAQKQEIEGIVYVSFIVEKNGQINEVKVLRGIGGGCDEEAIRVVSDMPNWKPAMHDGKPVRVVFNLPIRYRLD